jgi:hypothetical protein
MSDIVLPSSVHLERQLTQIVKDVEDEIYRKKKSNSIDDIYLAIDYYRLSHERLYSHADLFVNEYVPVARNIMGYNSSLISPHYDFAFNKSGIDYEYYGEKMIWLLFDRLRHKGSKIAVNISNIIDYLNELIALRESEIAASGEGWAYQYDLNIDDIIRYCIYYMGYQFYQFIYALRIPDIHKIYLMDTIIYKHFGFEPSLFCSKYDIVDIIKGIEPCVDDNALTYEEVTGSNSFINTNSQLFRLIKSYFTDNGITSPTTQNFAFYTKRFQFTRLYKLYMYIELNRTTSMTELIEFKPDCDIITPLYPVVTSTTNITIIGNKTFDRLAIVGYLNMGPSEEFSDADKVFEFRTNEVNVLITGNLNVKTYYQVGHTGFVPCNYGKEISYDTPYSDSVDYSTGFTIIRGNVIVYGNINLDPNA